VSGKPTLIGLDRPALKAALEGAGVPARQLAMRAGQVWNWAYVHGARDFAAMTNLARDFRVLLEENFTLARPEIVTAQVSQDGTRKWLL
jgi:23S rRNA (adenine2503-C2)-methyltransferase